MGILTGHPAFQLDCRFHVSILFAKHPGAQRSGQHSTRSVAEWCRGMGILTILCSPSIDRDTKFQSSQPLRQALRGSVEAWGYLLDLYFIPYVDIKKFQSSQHRTRSKAEWCRGMGILTMNRWQPRQCMLNSFNPLCEAPFRATPSKSIRGLCRGMGLLTELRLQLPDRSHRVSILSIPSKSIRGPCRGMGILACYRRWKSGQDNHVSILLTPHPQQSGAMQRHGDTNAEEGHSSRRSSWHVSILSTSHP
jgi:hypothetical protein